MSSAVEKTKATTRMTRAALTQLSGPPPSTLKHLSCSFLFGHRVAMKNLLYCCRLRHFQILQGASLRGLGSSPREKTPQKCRCLACHRHSCRSRPRPLLLLRRRWCRFQWPSAEAAGSWRLRSPSSSVVRRRWRAVAREPSAVERRATLQLTAQHPQTKVRFRSPSPWPCREPRQATLRVDSHIGSEYHIAETPVPPQSPPWTTDWAHSAPGERYLNLRALFSCAPLRSFSIGWIRKRKKMPRVC